MKKVMIVILFFLLIIIDGFVLLFRVEPMSTWVKSSDGNKISTLTNLFDAIKGTPTKAAPILLQNPELPTGCEATVGAMLLGAYGYSPDKLAVADAIPKGTLTTKDGVTCAPHPDDAFIGDPSSPYGYGVYAAPVTKALQSLIDREGGRHTAVNLTGATEQKILNILDKGDPVIIWVTIGLQKAEEGIRWYVEEREEYYTWLKHEHAVLLTGRSGKTLTVHDPLEGKTTYSQQELFDSYRAMGSRAIMLMA